MGEVAGEGQHKTASAGMSVGESESESEKEKQGRRVNREGWAEGWPLSGAPSHEHEPLIID